MELFRPIPIDVIQIDEKSVVDLLIKHEDRFIPFLEKGGIFTRDHLIELNNYGISMVYIREAEAVPLKDTSMPTQK